MAACHAMRRSFLSLQLKLPASSNGCGQAPHLNKSCCGRGSLFWQLKAKTTKTSPNLWRSNAGPQPCGVVG